MTEKYAGVGEAIRAGEAKPDKLAALRETMLSFKNNTRGGNRREVETIIKTLNVVLAEIDILAASDAPERDTLEEHSAFLAGVKMAVESGLGFASARRVDRLLRIALASPHASAAPSEEQAEQWLAKTPLARGRSEREEQPVVERVVRRILGSCGDPVPQLVAFIAALSSPSPAPTGEK